MTDKDDKGIGDVKKDDQEKQSKNKKGKEESE
jgi:hypothetical protein